MYWQFNWVLLWFSAWVLSKQTTSSLITNAITINCTGGGNASFEDFALKVGTNESIGDLQMKMEANVTHGTDDISELILLKVVTRKENKTLFETLISIEASNSSISCVLPVNPNDKHDYEIVGNLTTVGPLIKTCHLLFWPSLCSWHREKVDQEVRCDVRFEVSDTGSPPKSLQPETSPESSQRDNSSESPRQDTSSESPRQDIPPAMSGDISSWIWSQMKNICLIVLSILAI